MLQLILILIYGAEAAILGAMFGKMGVLTAIVCGTIAETARPRK
jgi:hypothetical protein